MTILESGEGRERSKLAKMVLRVPPDRPANKSAVPCSERYEEKEDVEKKKTMSHYEFNKLTLTNCSIFPIKKLLNVSH